MPEVLGTWKLTGRYRHTRGWFGRVKLEVEERATVYRQGLLMDYPHGSKTRWRRATTADIDMEIFTQEARDHG